MPGWSAKKIWTGVLSNQANKASRTGSKVIHPLLHPPTHHQTPTHPLTTIPTHPMPPEFLDID